MYIVLLSVQHISDYPSPMNEWKMFFFVAIIDVVFNFHSVIRSISLRTIISLQFCPVMTSLDWIMGDLNLYGDFALTYGLPWHQTGVATH